MSGQTKASERWAHISKLAKIRRLCAQARDYTFPAGQLQAGMQLATVDVPWLLDYIKELEDRINGAPQERDVAA